MNKASIGRIVHFVDTKGELRAAIISRVWGDACVNLTVFDDSGPYVATSVAFDGGGQALQSWHWPERTN